MDRIVEHPGISHFSLRGLPVPLTFNRRTQEDDFERLRRTPVGGSLILEVLVFQDGLKRLVLAPARVAIRIEQGKTPDAPYKGVIEAYGTAASSEWMWEDDKPS